MAGRNIRPQKRIGGSRLRRFVRARDDFRRNARIAQEMLVVDIARQLRSRYKAQSRYVQNPVSFTVWLIELERLEYTYSA